MNLKFLHFFRVLSNIVTLIVIVQLTCYPTESVSELTCSESMDSRHRCLSREVCRSDQQNTAHISCGPSDVGVCCPVINRRSPPRCGIRKKSVSYRQDPKLQGVTESNSPNYDAKYLVPKEAAEKGSNKSDTENANSPETQNPKSTTEDIKRWTNSTDKKDFVHTTDLHETEEQSEKEFNKSSTFTDIDTLNGEKTMYLRVSTTASEVTVDNGSKRDELDLTTGQYKKDELRATDFHKISSFTDINILSDEITTTVSTKATSFPADNSTEKGFDRNSGQSKNLKTSFHDDTSFTDVDTMAEKMNASATTLDTNNSKERGIFYHTTNQDENEETSENAFHKSLSLTNIDTIDGEKSMHSEISTLATTHPVDNGTEEDKYNHTTSQLESKEKPKNGFLEINSFTGTDTAFSEKSLQLEISTKKTSIATDNNSERSDFLYSTDQHKNEELLENRFSKRTSYLDNDATTSSETEQTKMSVPGTFLTAYNSMNKAGFNHTTVQYKNEELILLNTEFRETTSFTDADTTSAGHIMLERLPTSVISTVSVSSAEEDELYNVSRRYKNDMLTQNTGKSTTFTNNSRVTRGTFPTLLPVEIQQSSSDFVLTSNSVGMPSNDFGTWHPIETTKNLNGSTIDQDERLNSGKDTSLQKTSIDHITEDEQVYKKISSGTVMHDNSRNSLEMGDYSILEREKQTQKTTFPLPGDSELDNLKTGMKTDVFVQTEPVGPSQKVTASLYETTEVNSSNDRLLEIDKLVSKKYTVKRTFTSVTESQSDNTQIRKLTENFIETDPVGPKIESTTLYRMSGINSSEGISSENENLHYTKHTENPISPLFGQSDLDNRNTGKIADTSVEAIPIDLNHQVTDSLSRTTTISSREDIIQGIENVEYRNQSQMPIFSLLTESENNATKTGKIISTIIDTLSVSHTVHNTASVYESSGINSSGSKITKAENIDYTKHTQKPTFSVLIDNFKTGTVTDISEEMMPVDVHHEVTASIYKTTGINATVEVLTEIESINNTKHSPKPASLVLSETELGNFTTGTVTDNSKEKMSIDILHEVTGSMYDTSGMSSTEEVLTEIENVNYSNNSPKPESLVFSETKLDNSQIGTITDISGEKTPVNLHHELTSSKYGTSRKDAIEETVTEIGNVNYTKHSPKSTPKVSSETEIDDLKTGTVTDISGKDTPVYQHHKVTASIYEITGINSTKETMTEIENLNYTKHSRETELDNFENATVTDISGEKMSVDLHHEVTGSDEAHGLNSTEGEMTEIENINSTKHSPKPTSLVLSDTELGNFTAGTVTGNSGENMSVDLHQEVTGSIYEATGINSTEQRLREMENPNYRKNSPKPESVVLSETEFDNFKIGTITDISGEKMSVSLHHALTSSIYETSRINSTEETLTEIENINSRKHSLKTDSPVLRDTVLDNFKKETVTDNSEEKMSVDLHHEVTRSIYETSGMSSTEEVQTKIENVNYRKNSQKPASLIFSETEFGNSKLGAGTDSSGKKNSVDINHEVTASIYETTGINATKEALTAIGNINYTKHSPKPASLVFSETEFGNSKLGTGTDISGKKKTVDINHEVTASIYETTGINATEEALTEIGNINSREHSLKTDSPVLRDTELDNFKKGAVTDNSEEKMSVDLHHEITRSIYETSGMSSTEEVQTKIENVNYRKNSPKPASLVFSETEFGNSKLAAGTDISGKKKPVDINHEVTASIYETTGINATEEALTEIGNINYTKHSPKPASLVFSETEFGNSKLGTGTDISGKKKPVDINHEVTASIYETTGINATEGSLTEIRNINSRKHSLKTDFPVLRDTELDNFKKGTVTDNSEEKMSADLHHEVTRSIYETSGMSSTEEVQTKIENVNYRKNSPKPASLVFSETEFGNSKLGAGTDISGKKNSVDINNEVTASIYETTGINATEEALTEIGNINYTKHSPKPASLVFSETEFGNSKLGTGTDISGKKNSVDINHEVTASIYETTGINATEEALTEIVNINYTKHSPKPDSLILSETEVDNFRSGRVTHNSGEKKYADLHHVVTESIHEITDVNSLTQMENLDYTKHSPKTSSLALSETELDIFQTGRVTDISGEKIPGDRHYKATECIFETSDINSLSQIENLEYRKNSLKPVSLVLSEIELRSSETGTVRDISGEKVSVALHHGVTASVYEATGTNSTGLPLLVLSKTQLDNHRILPTTIVSVEKKTVDVNHEDTASVDKAIDINPSEDSLTKIKNVDCTKDSPKSLSQVLSVTEHNNHRFETTTDVSVEKISFGSDFPSALEATDSVKSPGPLTNEVTYSEDFALIIDSSKTEYKRSTENILYRKNEDKLGYATRESCERSTKFESSTPVTYNQKEASIVQYTKGNVQYKEGHAKPNTEGYENTKGDEMTYANGLLTKSRFKVPDTSKHYESTECFTGKVNVERLETSAIHFQRDDSKMYEMMKKLLENFQDFQRNMTKKFEDINAKIDRGEGKVPEKNLNMFENSGSHEFKHSVLAASPSLPPPQPELLYYRRPISETCNNKFQTYNYSDAKEFYSYLSSNTAFKNASHNPSDSPIGKYYPGIQYRLKDGQIISDSYIQQYYTSVPRVPDYANYYGRHVYRLLGGYHFPEYRKPVPLPGKYRQTREIREKYSNILEKPEEELNLVVKDTKEELLNTIFDSSSKKLISQKGDDMKPNVSNIEHEKEKSKEFRNSNENFKNTKQCMTSESETNLESTGITETQDNAFTTENVIPSGKITKFSMSENLGDTHAVHDTNFLRTGAKSLSPVLIQRKENKEYKIFFNRYKKTTAIPLTTFGISKHFLTELYVQNNLLELDKRPLWKNSSNKYNLDFKGDKLNMYRSNELFTLHEDERAMKSAARKLLRWEPKFKTFLSDKDKDTSLIRVKFPFNDEDYEGSYITPKRQISYRKKNTKRQNKRKPANDRADRKQIQNFDVPDYGTKFKGPTQKTTKTPGRKNVESRKTYKSSQSRKNDEAKRNSSDLKTNFSYRKKIQPVLLNYNIQPGLLNYTTPKSQISYRKKSIKGQNKRKSTNDRADRKKIQNSNVPDRGTKFKGTTNSNDNLTQKIKKTPGRKNVESRKTYKSSQSRKNDEATRNSAPQSYLLYRKNIKPALLNYITPKHRKSYRKKIVKGQNRRKPTNNRADDTTTPSDNYRSVILNFYEHLLKNFSVYTESPTKKYVSEALTDLTPTSVPQGNSLSISTEAFVLDSNASVLTTINFTTHTDTSNDSSASTGENFQNSTSEGGLSNFNEISSLGLSNSQGVEEKSEITYDYKDPTKTFENLTTYTESPSISLESTSNGNVSDQTYKSSYRAEETVIDGNSPSTSQDAFVLNGNASVLTTINFTTHTDKSHDSSASTGGSTSTGENFKNSTSDGGLSNFNDGISSLGFSNSRDIKEKSEITYDYKDQTKAFENITTDTKLSSISPESTFYENVSGSVSMKVLKDRSDESSLTPTSEYKSINTIEGTETVGQTKLESNSGEYFTKTANKTVVLASISPDTERSLKSTEEIPADDIKSSVTTSVSEITISRMKSEESSTKSAVLEQLRKKYLFTGNVPPETEKDQYGKGLLSSQTTSELFLSKTFLSNLGRSSVSPVLFNDSHQITPTSAGGSYDKILVSTPSLLHRYITSIPKKEKGNEVSTPNTLDGIPLAGRVTSVITAINFTTDRDTYLNENTSARDSSESLTNEDNLSNSNEKYSLENTQKYSNSYISDSSKSYQGNTKYLPTILSTKDSSLSRFETTTLDSDKTAGVLAITSATSFPIELKNTNSPNSGNNFNNPVKVTKANDGKFLIYEYTSRRFEPMSNSEVIDGNNSVDKHNNSHTEMISTKANSLNDMSIYSGIRNKNFMTSSCSDTSKTVVQNLTQFVFNITSDSVSESTAEQLTKSIAFKTMHSKPEISQKRGSDVSSERDEGTVDHDDVNTSEYSLRENTLTMGKSQHSPNTNQNTFNSQNLASGVSEVEVKAPTTVNSNEKFAPPANRTYLYKDKHFKAHTLDHEETDSDSEYEEISESVKDYSEASDFDTPHTNRGEDVVQNLTQIVYGISSDPASESTVEQLPKSITVSTMYIKPEIPQMKENDVNRGRDQGTIGHDDVNTSDYPMPSDDEYDEYDIKAATKETYYSASHRTAVQTLEVNIENFTANIYEKISNFTPESAAEQLVSGSHINPGKDSSMSGEDGENAKMYSVSSKDVYNILSATTESYYSSSRTVQKTSELRRSETDVQNLTGNVDARSSHSTLHSIAEKFSENITFPNIHSTPDTSQKNGSDVNKGRDSNVRNQNLENTLMYPKPYSDGYNATPTIKEKFHSTSDRSGQETLDLNYSSSEDIRYGNDRVNSVTSSENLQSSQSVNNYSRSLSIENAQLVFTEEGRIKSTSSGTTNISGFTFNSQSLFTFNSNDDFVSESGADSEYDGTFESVDNEEIQKSNSEYPVKKTTMDLYKNINSNGSTHDNFHPYVPAIDSPPKTRSDKRSEFPLLEDDIEYSRTIGGRLEYEAWPWIVSIYRASDMSFICAGTLIDYRHVLSAAHCFARHNKKDKYIVSIGKLLKIHRPIDGHPVETVFIHKGFEPSCYCNDVALLRLETLLGPEHVPTCLPDYDTADVGANATLLGWGDRRYKEGTDSGSVRLQRVNNLPIVSSKECRRIVSNILHRQLPPEFEDYYLCAGVPNGSKDACLGDSGGPLLHQSYDGMWTLLGIVSFGYKCGVPGVPGTYSRVSYYMPWILNIIDS